MAQDDNNEAPQAFSQNETDVGIPVGGESVDAEFERDSNAATAAEATAVAINSGKPKKSKKKEKLTKIKSVESHGSSSNVNNSEPTASSSYKIDQITCVDAYFYITLCCNSMVLYVSIFSLFIAYDIDSFWNKYDDTLCYDKYGFSANTFIVITWITLFLCIFNTSIGMIRNNKINKLKKEYITNTKIKKQKSKYKKFIRTKDDMIIAKGWFSCLYFLIFGICFIMSFILVGNISNARTFMSTIEADEEFCSDIKKSDISSIVAVMDAMLYLFLFVSLVALFVTWRYWKKTPSQVFAAGCAWFYA